MSVSMSLVCRDHNWETVRVPQWMGWWLPRLHMRLHETFEQHEEGR